MVRQAHTYLVSAMSGATLIAAAIAVFVVLVSVQVFEAWPIDSFGGGSGGETSSQAQSTGSGAAGAGGAAAGAGGAGAAATGADRNAGQGDDSVAAGGTGDRAFQPGGGAPGGDGGPVAGQDGAAGLPSSPGAGAAGSGGNGVSTGGGGGGGAGAGSGSSPSETVTNTVNETVNQVDQSVTGGALEKSGVTGVTEGVVDGTLGPESTVGQVVDGAVGAVGGLLQPKR